MEGAGAPAPGGRRADPAPWGRPEACRGHSPQHCCLSDGVGAQERGEGGGEMEQSLQGQSSDKRERDGVAAGPCVQGSPAGSYRRDPRVAGGLQAAF